jgi:hypothetical protein
MIVRVNTSKVGGMSHALEGQDCVLASTGSRHVGVFSFRFEGGFPMVRMCEVMTFACATILVAGSASAASKTVAAADAAQLTAVTNNVAVPGAARELAKDWTFDASTFGLGGGCDCTWFNGAFDGRNGQISHLGGAVEFGAKAADDFYLCEGYIYDLESITVTLLTTSFPQFTKARLELYSDCDGAPNCSPAGLLYTFEKSSVVETGQNVGVDNAGTPIRIVNVTFRPSQEVLKKNQNIVLKGGSYWISAYGLTDGLSPMGMRDVTYWGTTGAGIIKGSVAKKIDGVQQSVPGQFNFPGCWRSVEECCVGCSDLAFTVCARACKILVDNGEGNPSLTPAGSISQFAPFTSFDSRSADDFVAPPCSDLRICYIEGCIYTNCDPLFFRGAFEIYGNACRIPSYALAGTTGSSSTLGSGEATKVIDLGYTVTIDGRALRAYKLEFHDLNIVLPGGQQYWISVGVRHTFSLNERAYFCYNFDCDRSCLIRWNPGQVLVRPAGMPMQPEWTSVGRDFSFLIASDNAVSTAGNSTAACPVDFDRNGSVNLDDMFGYLNAWFAGCP